MSHEEKRKVEWSFSFEELGNRFNEMLGSLAGDAEVKHETFTVARDNAKAARVKLNLSLGKVTIHALPAGHPNLMEAELAYVGEVRLDVSGDAQKRTIHLHQPWSGHRDLGKPFREALRAVSNRDDLRWEIRLSADVVLELDIDGGLGATDINLSGLRLSSIELDAGVGSLNLTLPDQEEPIHVELDGGVGHTRIDIPAALQAEIKLDSGVGATELYVPQDAAVRLKTDGGIGGLHLPSTWHQVEKGEDFIVKSGVWETAGFSLATRKITIYHDGGVGGLTISHLS